MKKWSDKSVFYHIYPLGFCGSTYPNDGISEPQERLLKVIEWIPHMKELGVTALYLGPVFESYLHGYDTTDYFRVDRRLGTNDSLKKVSAALHNNGIKLVLDGVFNHVGRGHFAFKEILHFKENSNYRFWFNNINFGENNCYNDGFSYEGWSGCLDLVKLNLSNPEVTDYLLNAVSYWIDEFNIDGIRLDAADSIDFHFFKKLKKLTSSLNQEFWLMGEVVHGNYSRWANSEMLDSTTNYECYKGLYSSINDKNMFEIAHSLKRQFGISGIYRGLTLYSFADNHDVNRVASSLKRDEKLYSLYALLFTMPGIPSIYYGSEFGIQGVKNNGNDSALRPNLELHNLTSTAKHPHLPSAIRKFADCRAKLDSLKYGDYSELIVKNEQLVFSRKYENEEVFVAINISDEPSEMEFPVNNNLQFNDILNNEKILTDNNKLKVTIPANWARILLGI